MFDNDHCVCLPKLRHTTATGDTPLLTENHAAVSQLLSTTPFPALSKYEHLWVPRYFSTPRYLVSAGKAILVLVIAHETKQAWHSSLGSFSIAALLIRRRCFSEDAILCFFSIVMRCTYPLCMGLSVHVASSMFLSFFVCWLPTVVAPR